MQPTDNDASPVTSTTLSSGAVWTPEEEEELGRIFVESLREGIRQNQAAENQQKKGLFGWVTAIASRWKR